MNGNEVVKFAGDTCVPTLTTLNKLGQEDLSQIENERQKMLSSQSIMISTSYSDNNSVNSGFIISGMSMFNINNLSVVKYSGENFVVVRKENFPNKVGRILVSNEIVSFVDLDNKVQMKPIACLESEEKQLIDSIKLEIKQGEEEMLKRQKEREEQRQQREIEREQQREQKEREREIKMIEREREERDRQREERRRQSELQRLERQRQEDEQRQMRMHNEQRRMRMH